MNLETALEDLYGSDPAEFTKKRDELAKELKASGDKEAATALKARRKPTQIAWLLNTLARKHPEAIADLVDVGRELAREQRKALRGEEASGLKSAIERQRKAIHALAEKATAMMKALDVEPGAHVDAITSALQAALVDPAVGAQLEAGRLEKAPEVAVGFGGPITPDSEREVAAKQEPAPEQEPATEEVPATRPSAEDAKAARAAKAEAAMAERAAKVEAAKARAAHAKELAAAKSVAKAADAAATNGRHAAERAERAARDAIALAKKLADEAAALATVAAEAASAVTRVEANGPD